MSAPPARASGGTSARCSGKRGCRKFSERICWRPSRSALRSYKVLLGGKLLAAGSVPPGGGLRSKRCPVPPPLPRAVPARRCPVTARAPLIAARCQGHTNKAPLDFTCPAPGVPEHAELGGMGTWQSRAARVLCRRAARGASQHPAGTRSAWSRVTARGRELEGLKSGWHCRQGGVRRLKELRLCILAPRTTRRASTS